MKNYQKWRTKVQLYTGLPYPFNLFCSFLKYLWKLEFNHEVFNYEESIGIVKYKE